MKSLHSPRIAAFSLFAILIASSATAQNFKTDGYTVTSYITRSATGSGSWGVGWNASNGSVSAYVIGGSGTATCEVEFQTDIVRNTTWATEANVHIVAALSGNVGSITTGKATSSVDGGNSHFSKDTSAVNPFSWGPAGGVYTLSPQTIYFTAHADVTDTDTNTVNDAAQSTDYFDVY